MRSISASRAVLARIDAAEIAASLASPPMIAPRRHRQLRTTIAVDQDFRRQHAEGLDRTPHRKHGGLQDIDAVDLFDRCPADRVVQRLVTDFGGQEFASSRGELLRIGEFRRSAVPDRGSPPRRRPVPASGPRPASSTPQTRRMSPPGRPKGTSTKQMEAAPAAEPSSPPFPGKGARGDCRFHAFCKYGSTVSAAFCALSCRSRR
jgi:hypothetical protein